MRKKKEYIYLNEDYNQIKIKVLCGKKMFGFANFNLVTLLYLLFTSFQRVKQIWDLVTISFAK